MDILLISSVAYDYLMPFPGRKQTKKAATGLSGQLLVAGLGTQTRT